MIMGPITYTYEELIAHKQNLNVSEAVLEKLKSDADAVLEKPLLSVTTIKLPRPSGDAHDYVSIAPYRWPNPDTPDGLPWIPRDGYVNPDTRTGVHPSAMYGNIHTLALAAFYFPESAKRYAEYASAQLYTWFIDPETRINPNAKYGQSIPGVTEGRGAGLIEFSQTTPLYNAIGIFECMGIIDEKLVAGIKEWFVEFANWMLTHELGIRIDTTTDNHASWYSANLLSTAIFTNRPALIKKMATESYTRRIRVAIEPDGSQPIELHRTKGIGYSFYNLDAMFIFSSLAERLGYTEHWGIDPERGVCILKSAVDFIYPYVVDPDSFPYEELHKGQHRSRMARALLVVDKRYPGEGYAERAAQMLTGNEAWLLEPLL